MTQGLVTILRSGKVVMKAVAGCEGYEGAKLTDAVVSGRIPLTLDAVYGEARRIGFGSPDDLVVWTADDDLRAFSDDLPPLYRPTFNQPRFNPRWESGFVYHLWVVEMEPTPRVVEAPVEE